VPLVCLAAKVSVFVESHLKADTQTNSSYLMVHCRPLNENSSFYWAGRFRDPLWLCLHSSPPLNQLINGMA